MQDPSQQDPSQLQPTDVPDGSGALGAVRTAHVFALRYDGVTAWLSWSPPRGQVVARAAGTWPRAAALDALAGLPSQLAEDRAAGLARLWRHVTPGTWVAAPAEQVPCTIARPGHDAPARWLRRERRTGWTLVPTRDGLDATTVEDYRDRIAGGRRPVVTALAALDSITRRNSHAPSADNPVTRLVARDRVGLVVDGHHALQAYLDLGVRPTVLAVGPYGPGGTPVTHQDLDAALGGQPRTRWLARAAYARIPPGLAGPQEIVVEVPDGLGLVAVAGDDDASVLWLGGRPALLEGADMRGSVGRLAARAGAGAPRGPESQALRDWLAAPGLTVEGASGAASPPDAERLRPLLRLLRSGSYRIRAYVPWESVTVVDPNRKGVTNWYPSDDVTLVATDTWPPPDEAMVARYRQQIAAGGYPAVVVLRASADPPGGAAPETGYLLDGHHKLAAYRAAQADPLLIELAPAQPGRLRKADIEALLPEDDREPFDSLLRFWRDPPSAAHPSADV